MDVAAGESGVGTTKRTKGTAGRVGTPGRNPSFFLEKKKEAKKNLLRVRIIGGCGIRSVMPEVILYPLELNESVAKLKDFLRNRLGIPKPT